MTLVARVSAMHRSARRFYAGAGLRLPNGTTAQWLLGIAAVTTAAVLFLVSALALGLMLSQLRSEMQTAERTRTLELQMHGIGEDLEDAAGATRYYLKTGDRTGMAMVRIEGRNAVRRLESLIAYAPDEAVALRSIARQVEADLAALSSGGGTGSAMQAVTLFHDRQSAAYAECRARIDRHIVFFIVFAVVMALVGPALGVIGLALLQRDRGSRRARELQSELMHVQRLAVMGQTAAMLAHEVSHPLTAANNYLAALKRTAANGDCSKTAEFSERAAQQIHRAATILCRLRRFIEKRDAERTAVAPAVLIQDAVALIGPLDGDVALETAIAPDLSPVVVDRVQIQQVLVNLIRNALDAMTGCTERRLAIAAYATEAGQVEFVLSDTGRGVSPDIAAKLFQPFVTTKQDGMGVGLSICRSIIASHGGTISAEPNPQGGAVFRFRLPAAPK